MQEQCRIKKCGGGNGEGMFRMENLCYSKKIKDENEFFDTFPVFTFELDNGVSYDWEPAAYLYTDDDDDSLYCLGLNKIS